MRHFTLFLLSLTLACDPTAEQPKAAEQPKTADLTKPAAPAEPIQPAKVADPAKPEPNFGTCMTGCSEGKASATDRATCRLNCGVVFKAPPASTPPRLAPIATCMGACAGPTGEADATCLKACRDTTTAPAVLDALATCVTDCYADATKSADDRSTCRLLCAQAGELTITGVNL